MQTLKGKVALVTGSARRIGAATVQILHQAGATVIVHYHRSSEEAEALCEKLNTARANSCFLQQADLQDMAAMPAMIESIIKQAGRLDILVNNASSFFPTPLQEMDEQHWDNLMGSNLKAPLFLAQAAADQLTKNQGCIVNMVDVYGYRPLQQHTIYSVAKAGLAMLTQSLARELGPAVRVNGVAPGAILWPENDSEGGAQAQQTLLDKTCLQRAGSPADIAQAILFLVKDADYITGHVLPVDGGRLTNI